MVNIRILSDNLYDKKYGWFKLEYTVHTMLNNYQVDYTFSLILISETSKLC
jgi:hypothetical protein